MRSIRVVLAILPVFIILFSLPYQLVAQDQTKILSWLKTASDADKMKFWAQLSSEMNKLYPMTADSETEVLNAAQQKNGLIWNYMFINQQYSDRSQEEWDDYLSTIYADRIKMFCSTPESLFLRAANASIRNNYYDRNGKYIGRTVFNAGSECKK